MLSGLIPYNGHLVRRLREEGILKDFDPRRMKEHEKFTLVSCPDCERFNNLYMYLRAVCGAKIHPLTQHGGACRFVTESPMNITSVPGYADQQLEELRKAVMVIVQSPLVLSTCHLPCGMARLSNMNWVDVLQESALAQQRIEGLISAAGGRVEVSTLVHIHWRNEPKDEDPQRTYSFDVEKWPALYPLYQQEVLAGVA